MSASDPDREKTRHDEELRIQRQIAFASGIFQGDVTVRTLLESLAEGVVVIDNSGTILLVNSRAEQMFGYPERELVGTPHAVLIPERFRKIHEEHEAHFFQEPRIRPMGQLLELAGRRRDGSEFPVEISLGFIDTINGILVLALVSDMALRKQFETRLQESEKQFRILVEGVKDYAILMLDTDGNVLSWNAGVELLHGYGEKEIIGKHFSCFYPEKDRDRGKPADVLKKAAAEGRVEDEGWRIRKDGGQFWADLIIAALCDEIGNLQGFSIVTRDVTERKRAQEALKTLNAELERSNRDLELFASVTSHDLQEPLQTITSYIELLALRYKDKLDQKADTYIGYILDGTNHMRLMINDLLAYSRVGTRAQLFGQIKMDSALDQALDSLGKSIAESNAAVERDELPEVEGDDTQLAELFQNLIGNAIKFRKKEVKLQIRISVERKENEWVFGVHDNGIGLEPRFFDRIFGIFQRLHTREEYEGSGIGLAIVRKIVERHGGRVWVESRFGEGSSFYFTMPARGGSHEA